MNLNRSQLSLLITAFSLSIVVLILFNLHLGAEQEDEYVIELSLADEELEALLEEEERLREMLENTDPVESHMASNETAKPSVEYPEPLKTLEEILQEKAAEMDPEEARDFLNSENGYSANLKEILRQRELNKQKLDELEAKKQEFTRNLENKRTSVSYSLVDRNSYELPPPIYTCIEGGKVVINITVDAYGYVKEATYNSKSSNTANGCLVDNAITYALRARFDTSDKASQIGTITYIFQSK
ncbi:MAG: hypothetical protein KJN96_04935 [Eudoraea sp.]|nr:hypothetical protein [Eudoraea sp.]MBT8222497.1 hypothetical protein [Eudoraea sp.]NNJ40584.1 hypothetical protein [Eudoraea sp.]